MENEKRGIRTSVQQGQIHVVRDQQGGVFLATKEGACWVGLWGELLMFVEDLGTPEDLVVREAGFRHIARLVDKSGSQWMGLVDLARELLKRRKE